MRTLVFSLLLATASPGFSQSAALGLENVHVDEVGNVIGTRPGKDRAARH